MRWTIEVRNYRCFSDANPLRFDLSNQVTALIGPNNSGKTSALKFFWELGQMMHLVPGSAVAQHHGSNSFRAIVNNAVRSLSDPYAIFTELNDRPLSIDFHQHGGEFPESEFINHRTPTIQKPLTVNDVIPISYRLKIDRSSFLAEIFLLKEGREVVIDPRQFEIEQRAAGLLYVDRLDAKCYYFDRLNGLEGLYHSTFLPAVRSFGSLNLTANYDLHMGQNLIMQWNAYKLSNNSAGRKLAATIEKDVARIFGFKHLEITANQTNDDFILRINNDRSFLLKDMGSGISQFLTVLFNVLPRGNQIVLVDEPEIGIHASLQVELLTLITKYANGPVLFATHSIGLARSVSDSIVSFRMVDGESLSKEFERSPSHLETLGELSFSAWREIGCDSVVFVEGVHDVKVMREWLKLLGNQFRSVVLPLGGSEFVRSDGVEAIKQVLQVHPRVIVVIDSERESVDSELESKRKKFAEECSKLGLPCHVTQYRATENYFTETAVKAAIGSTARSLSNFEKLADHGWGKRDGFKIAAAMTHQELLSTDVGQFLLTNLS